VANRIVDIHKLRDGRLHVFKRDDSRYRLCRFFVNGRYKVKSTGEEQYSAAKMVMIGNWMKQREVS
jgi:hypothetical protein